MANDRLHEPHAQPPAAMRLVDEDVAQPGEGRQVGDHASEPDLAPVLAQVQSEVQRVLN
jgi:hypothetical protein